MSACEEANAVVRGTNNRPVKKYVLNMSFRTLQLEHLLPVRHLSGTGYVEERQCCDLWVSAVGLAGHVHGSPGHLNPRE